MAFAIGSRARVRLVQTGVLGTPLNPQPPVLGVVTQLDTPNPGDVTVAVPWGAEYTEDEAFLDEIKEADALTRGAFVDKVVSAWITPPSSGVDGVPYSDPYTGRVVDVYYLNGSPAVLILSLSTGMFYELPIAAVHVIGDR